MAPTCTEQMRTPLPSVPRAAASCSKPWNVTRSFASSTVMAGRRMTSAR